MREITPNENVATLPLSDAVCEAVIVGEKHFYVMLLEDGRVLVEGQWRLSPGDKIYEITDSFAKGGATYSLELKDAVVRAKRDFDEGSGTGWYETLISANEKIDRSFDKTTVGLICDKDWKAQNVLTDDIWSDPQIVKDYFGYHPDSYQARRYKEILDTETTNVMLKAACEIDKYFTEAVKPDERMLLEYVVRQAAEKFCKPINGYLQLHEGTQMNHQVHKALNKWRANGGKFGHSVFSAVAKFTGDYAEADQAAAVYGGPRVHRDGEVVGFHSRDSEKKGS